MAASQDISLTNVTAETLRNEITPLVNIPYLSKHALIPCVVSNSLEARWILGIPYLGQAAENDARKVAKYIDGHLYSPRCHPIVPCVVRTYSGEARWVFFVVDTTAPVTYLSPQAHEALRISASGPTFLYVAGYSHQVYPSPVDSQFADINILEGDFFQANEGCVEYSRSGKIRVVLARWDEIKRDQEAMLRTDLSE